MSMVKDKLRKMWNLAKSTTYPDEKVVALKKLNELLEFHDMTLDDILDFKYIVKEFTTKTQFEYIVLIKLLQNDNIEYLESNSETKVVKTISYKVLEDMNDKIDQELSYHSGQINIIKIGAELDYLEKNGYI